MKHLKFILLLFIICFSTSFPTFAVESSINVQRQLSGETHLQQTTVKSQNTLYKLQKKGKIKNIIMWSVFVISIICIIIGLSAEILAMTLIGLGLMLIPLMIASLD